MADITLDSIIRELEERIPRLKYVESFIPHYIYADMGEYERWVVRTKRFLNLHFPNDKYVEEFEETSKKQLWLEQQQTLLAILKAIADLPTVIPQKGNKKEDDGINITANFTNTNSQSQNQEQYFLRP